VTILRSSGFLLQNGAKPNVSTDYSYGGIPLLRAADYRDIEIISLLWNLKLILIQRTNRKYCTSQLGRVHMDFSWPYKNTTGDRKNY